MSQKEKIVLEDAIKTAIETEKENILLRKVCVILLMSNILLAIAIVLSVIG